MEELDKIIRFEFILDDREIVLYDSIIFKMKVEY